MLVLLVEPYFAGSHRAWAKGYRSASAHTVRLVTHEGRFWKWRMQGGHVTLAAEVASAVADLGRPDVLLVSSMTNLPALLGASRRTLGDVPAVLYMHENQLGYPWSPQDRPDATYAMINWVSMAAADLVLFNSAYHRDELLAALPRFLGQFPDRRHERLVAAVEARSEVLAPGVMLRRLDGPRRRTDPPLVLWNQRWEHDKAPGDFAAAVTAVAALGVDFRLALAGESFVSAPPAFEALAARFGPRVVHYGFASEPDYVELLRSADVVVSTARHEYFGVAVTEAVYAGAFPLLVDRVVYPERLPAAHHRRCLFADGPDLVEKLGWALRHRDEAASIAAALRPVMAAFDWGVMAPRYDARLAALVASPTGG